MSAWVLAIAIGLAGTCEDQVDAMLAHPEFEESFRSGLTAEARGGFVAALKASGVEDPAFLDFAAEYWTPRLQSYMVASYPSMKPALEDWVIDSLGCKRIKQLRREKPYRGWDGLDPTEAASLQGNSDAMLAHPAMQGVLQGLDPFMQSLMPEFNEALAAFVAQAQ